MQIGIIGLGKMGGNMARRLRRSGVEVVGFNQDADKTKSLEEDCGLIPANSPEDLITRLVAPRLVWLMLPAGEVTESYVQKMHGMLQPGDVLIDGANSHYKDSIRRGEFLDERNILFIDAGVSGGVWGLENGYALMVGGSDNAFTIIKPIVETLAPTPDSGWTHTGPVGSGHYTKMIHNGIEYGMMQAYAEGFALLKARDDFNLDLADIAKSWRVGSVIRSWLLDLSADVLANDQQLDDVEPFVADSGEGRWTAIEGIEQGIPTPVMSLALMARFSSQGKQDYSAKLLSMMRNQFGGHAIRSKDK